MFHGLIIYNPGKKDPKNPTRARMYTIRRKWVFTVL